MLIALVAVFCAMSARAHEFWIEAEAYQMPSGVPVKARLFNGESFNGIELAWFEGRIAMANWAQGDVSLPIFGRAGDRPALGVDQAQAGLLRILYQSTASEVSYSDWDKFARFVSDKGAEWVLARHKERGLVQDGFRESYTRFCKALIGVDDGAGQDAFSGMELEFVALDNPYRNPVKNRLALQLFYQDAVRGGAQIELFERAKDGAVTQTKLITDEKGMIRINAKPGHRYLVNAVVLRELDVPGTPWESLWASLTFEIPE